MEDKYTAVVYNFFVRPKKIEFKLDDVNVPKVTCSAWLALSPPPMSASNMQSLSSSSSLLYLFCSSSSLHS